MSYVMPGHPSGLQDRNGIADVVADVLEIENARIIVILPGEECKREISGMDVREGMIVRVPATETQIQSTYAGKVIVDYNDLVYGFK